MPSQSNKFTLFLFTTQLQPIPTSRYAHSSQSNSSSISNLPEDPSQYNIVVLNFLFPTSVSTKLFLVDML